MIYGELVKEKYTFLDTQPDEKKDATFPMLSELVGGGCCWTCGDTVTDHWMADLERFGYAKSFDVKWSWSVQP